MPNSIDSFNILAEKSHAPELNRSFYDALHTMIEDAVALADTAARDAAMFYAYQYVTNMASKSTLVHRGVMTWSRETYEKYGNQNTFVSAMDTSNAVEQLFGDICREIGTEYECKPRMGLSYQEYMDYIRGLANSVTMKDVQNEFFKQATPKTLSDSISIYASNLASARNHTYSNDFTVPENRNVAEVYSLYENARASIRNAGFFGNLFHPIDFFRNIGVMRAASKLLDKFGFNKETDGLVAMEAFESTVDQCAGKDLADLTEMKGQVKQVMAYEEAKANNVKEIAVARDKLREAAKSGKEMLVKINEILEKYDTAVIEDNAREGMIFDLSKIPEEKVAGDYDRLRQTDGFSTYIKGIFFTALTKMADGATKNHISVSDMIKDASDIAVMMADKYTVLYDAPELKELAQSSAFGSYTPDKIYDLVERCLGGNAGYDSEKVKAEINKTVSEYTNPIIENSRLEKAEETVNENQADDLQKDEKLRTSIVVELGDKSQPEQKQEKIDGTTLAKEQIVK